MFNTSNKIAALAALTMVAVLLADAGLAYAQPAAPTAAPAAPTAPPANAAPGTAGAVAPANQQPNPAVGQLLNQIQFASNEDARASAAKELAKINDPRTLLVLIQAAVYDSEDSVRQAARTAAMKVSNGNAPRQAVEIGTDPVGTLMTQVLDGKEADQRRQAAKDLGRSTDAHALAALEIAAVFDRDDAVRDLARKAAVQIWQSMSLADPASGSTNGPSTAVAANGPAVAPTTTPVPAPTLPAPANPSTPVVLAPAGQPTEPVPAPQVIYPPTPTNPPVPLQPVAEVPVAPAVPVTPVAPATSVASTPAVAPTPPIAPGVPGNPSLIVPQAQMPTPYAQPGSPPTYPPGSVPPPSYVTAALAAPPPPVVAPPPTVIVRRSYPGPVYYNPATGCYYTYPPAYYYPPAVVYSPAPSQFSLGVNLGFVFGRFHRR